LPPQLHSCGFTERAGKAGKAGKPMDLDPREKL